MSGYPIASSLALPLFVFMFVVVTKYSREDPLAPFDHPEFPIEAAKITQ